MSSKRLDGSRVPMQIIIGTRFQPAPTGPACGSTWWSEESALAIAALHASWYRPTMLTLTRKVGHRTFIGAIEIEVVDVGRDDVVLRLSGLEDESAVKVADASHETPSPHPRPAARRRRVDGSCRRHDRTSRSSSRSDEPDEARSATVRP